ncbi:thermonuclease family protein [Floridanema evergladense]
MAIDTYAINLFFLFLLPKTEKIMSSIYYRFIRGKFVIVGKEPDGDSVRFVADKPDFYRELYRSYRIKPSRNDGSVQLRLEAIDAPETHYGKFAQPLGKEARDRFLQWIGFTDIQYKGDRVTDSNPKTVSGAILTKAADVNGRPISYLILEDANFDDGEWIKVDEQLLEKTANFYLLSQGTAYYTVYTSTPLLHRQFFRQTARKAEQQNLGVWEKDATSEFVLEEFEDIGPEGQLILPKLFRRCIDYLKSQSEGFRGNLQDWLIGTSEMVSRNENDRLLINDSWPELRLSDIIEQRNRRIVFTADLLDITFLEK